MQFAPRLFRTALISGLLLLSCMAQAQNATIEIGNTDYPKLREVDGGTVLIHQPQINSWNNFQELEGWLALEVVPKGSDENWIGSALIRAKTDIDFDERLVVLHDFEVLERKFPGQTPPEAVLATARSAISLKPKAVPLDFVIHALPEDFEVAGTGPRPEIKSDPPKIHVATERSALMIIQGEPLKIAIEDTDLEFVANTNWDLFYHKKKKAWYVLNQNAWQTSKDLQGNKWKTTTRLPSDFKKLPDEENWSEVKKYLPAKKPKLDPRRLIVSTGPAELINIDGAPRLTGIEETGISFVDNTDVELFQFEGAFYFLVSGRWFTTQDLDQSNWAAVEELPTAFQQIPSDHVMGHVLVSVPGTEEARAARIQALIPRTAQVSMDAGEAVKVEYGGNEPQLVDIEGTDLKRAANTRSQVIFFDNQYWLCENAVWFFSDSADGPWTVARKVPDEIYKIPPSDPAHNVTYVYVIEKEAPATSTTTTSSSSSTSTYVTYGYTSGYYGMYTTRTTVVFGTGYYYDPWIYPYPYYYGYPGYYYYPMSYGYGSWYNPATGFYGNRAVAYGPYGGAASTSVYNPRTGTYGRGYSAWDGDELARSGYAYNPRTNSYAAGNSYYDYDDNEGWREGYVQRGDRWAYAESEFKDGRISTEYETSRGVSGSGTRTRNADGSLSGQGTIQVGDRTGTTTSRQDSSGAQVSIRGDEGGSLDIQTDADSTKSAFEGRTAEGTGFEGGSERTNAGRRTEFSTDDGARGAVNYRGDNTSGVVETGSGDLYAGRNGEVYKRGSDGGWQKYDGGEWSPIDRGGSTSFREKERSSFDRSGDRRTQFERRQANSGSLDRQYRARQNGSRNFSRFQSQRRSFGGGRARRGGRRG